MRLTGHGVDGVVVSGNQSQCSVGYVVGDQVQCGVGVVCSTYDVTDEEDSVTGSGVVHNVVDNGAVVLFDGLKPTVRGDGVVEEVGVGNKKVGHVLTLYECDDVFV